MKVEFDLSKKKKMLWADGSNLDDLETYEELLGYPVYEPKDIKEFIKRDTALIRKFARGEISYGDMMDERDKLAGDKLIEKGEEK